MTDDEIHAALVRWLATRTSVLVIQADQGGDLPSLPYVMVRMTGLSEVRENEQDTEYSEDDASGRVFAKPIIETEWRFSIHAYAAASPSDILRPLRAAAKLAQVNEPLMPGLVIHELSQIRNVPDFANNKWEPRAQMDLMLRGLAKDGHLIDTIEEHSPFVFTRETA